MCKVLTAKQIAPKEQLEFHDCFLDRFECAKLSLPLDYFNGTHADTRVSIAIVKLPAKVAVNDPRYGGPILLNPGGPGGPGASFALLTAQAIQNFIDGSADPASAGKDTRFFDIIGFDPRGVQWSEPTATCFSDPAAAWSWRLREIEEGILGSSDVALGRLWAMSHASSSSCALAASKENGPDIKQYMSTAFVAQDMLQIVEKHAEYVAQQAAQATNSRSGHHDSHGISALPYVPGLAKLQYWGFSYGTVLGSTFASMFPGRLGSVVLDGVVNDRDYYHSLGGGSLTDNEKAMKSFYSWCLLSGPFMCPLAGHDTDSMDKIEKRVEGIVESLYHSPVSLTSLEGPDVVTYSDIKSVIFSTIYQPQLGFVNLAYLLTDIERGHVWWPTNLFRLVPTLSCGVNGTVNPGSLSASDIPTYAILCSDGVDQGNVEVDEFVEYWHNMKNMSSAAGDIWAMLKMKCANWKIRASYKFDGRFGGNTSHPILFISNTADPVTPLRSGRIMSSKFPNSGLLINDQAGHCSFSAPNGCALDRIREYFQTGALPANNTLCVPRQSPFSLNSTDPKSPFFDPTLESYISELAVSEKSSERPSIRAALQTLQSVMTESGAFGFSGLIGNMKTRQIQQLVQARYRN